MALSTFRGSLAAAAGIVTLSGPRSWPALGGVGASQSRHPRSRYRATTRATHNVPAGTTVTHFGRWTAATAGTFFTGGPLPNGDDTFGSAGTYTNVNTVSQPA